MFNCVNESSWSARIAYKMASPFARLVSVTGAPKSSVNFERCPSEINETRAPMAVYVKLGSE